LAEISGRDRHMPNTKKNGPMTQPKNQGARFASRAREKNEALLKEIGLMKAGTFMSPVANHTRKQHEGPT
jgi:hypothetical protein